MIAIPKRDVKIETLDQLLAEVSKHAHNILITESQPSMMPMYHIVSDETELVVGCPWRNDDEKMLTLAAVKKTAREMDATMVGFVCEMWMTRAAPGVDLDTMVPPSQSPDRIEGVLAMATDGDTTKVQCWNIVRGERNMILALVPRPQEELGRSDLFSGRMIDGLLPTKRRYN